MRDPYQAPHAAVADVHEELEYVGFWARIGASIIDSIIVVAVTYPLLFAVYGKEYFATQHIIMGSADVVLNYVLPAIAVIVFWVYKSATPGKMVIGARIVDAKTGAQPSTGQLIGRYAAYYVSLIPLGLGFFWVGWDARKQGWHDKLAGTVVVRTSNGARHPVTFGA